MKKMIIGTLALIAVAGLFGLALQVPVSAGEQHQQSQDKKTIYYCPMHPSVTSDHKGSCPICGMDLVKKKDKAVAKDSQPAAQPQAKERKVKFFRNPMDPTVTSPVFMKDSMGMDYIPVYEEAQPAGTETPGFYVSAEKQQLIGVKTDVVQKHALAREIVASGKVAFDKELFVAQEEFLQALRAADEGKGSALKAVRDQSAELAASAEKKLFLLGMGKAEIADLKKRGKPQDELYLSGSSDKAWIYVTVYERELGGIREGQEVSIEAVALPGEVFQGKIAGITPVLSGETRSARVRAEVENPGGRLKPDMFVNAKVMVDAGSKLAVPQEAVMDSGLRKIVYVVKNDHFVPREVSVGVTAGGFIEIRDGLSEGDMIVTSGNFLIDSESKLKGL